MHNFAAKSEWTKEEWAIFLAKLDVLRFRSHLKKKEFSDKIGVWNLYRKDLKRPGHLTILRICDVFKVSKEWLCSDEPDDEEPRNNGANLVPLPNHTSHVDIIDRFQNKALANGMDIMELAEIAGHVDPQMIIKVYAHLAKDLRKGNATKLPPLHQASKARKPKPILDKSIRQQKRPLASE